MSMIDEMRKDDKQYREYRMFHDRVECIVKRWAPDDRREQAEFTADLMMLFQALMIGQAQVYGDAMARQMEQNLQLGSLLPRAPTVTK